MEQLGQDGVESRRVVIISQDSFYRELSEDEAEDARKGNFNFDHPGETSHCFAFFLPITFSSAFCNHLFAWCLLMASHVRSVLPF